MAEGTQRRLAAILAADVAGYSRLMGEDEAGTLEALRHLRRELFAPAVAQHRGTLVKSMGDGWLVEFASAGDGVNCAIQIQEQLAIHDTIKLRIGLHIGDVTFEDEDIYGDGVNIAARLQEVAAPGAIVVSDTARRSIDGKLAVAFVDLGIQELKNIAEPVAAYGWGMTSVQVETVLPTSLDKPSIAVLPFVNMSGDSEQEYFSDGITDDIVTALSRLRDFFVIARNTTMAFKGENKSAQQLANDLGVRYVLEGSVRAIGNRVRVTAQLTDAASGNHLWAERYDRSLDDVFAIQDEITENVVGSIEPELYAAEHALLKQKPPQNLGAWECFVRGMYLYSQHTEVGTREAQGMLSRAIELDVDYAKARGLSAVNTVWRTFQGWEDPDVAFAKVTEAANIAIQCDPQEPWAHLAHGFVAMALRRNPESVAAFQRAIDASPNFAYAHSLLGAAHAMGGRPDEALPLIDRGVRLSPRDIFGEEYHLHYAFAYFQAGRYADAAASAELAIQLRPGHPVLYIMAAASHSYAGEAERAKIAATKLADLTPNFSAADIEQTFPYIYAEDRARLIDGLRKAGVPG